MASASQTWSNCLAALPGCLFVSLIGIELRELIPVCSSLRKRTYAEAKLCKRWNWIRSHSYVKVEVNVKWCRLAIHEETYEEAKPALIMCVRGGDRRSCLCGGSECEVGCVQSLIMYVCTYLYREGESG